MKMVKMFDWFEDIHPYLDTLNIGYDLFRIDDLLGECVGNDTACSFLVSKNGYGHDSIHNILVDYFLSQGCKKDETVYIWICW